MSRRVERVADEILHVVADLVRREIKDPRIGMVTFTKVKLSADLRHARVYFSVMGGVDARDRSLAGLQSATRFVRSRLGRRLGLRVAPELVFTFDSSLEEADRVSRLLRGVGAAEGEDERNPNRR